MDNEEITETFDAFEMWCNRRILRTPWTARVTNASVLEQIAPTISLEAFVANQKPSHFLVL